MRMYEFVIFQGAKGKIKKKALIDTGAEISLIPIGLATEIGVERTNETRNLVGVHGQGRVLPLGLMGAFFPSLNNKGGQFFIAISDKEKEPIIGMNILRPLGISIDTKTSQLQVKNEIWEAFKTLSAVGVAAFLTIEVLKVILKE